MSQQVNTKLQANAVKNKATLFWFFHVKEFLLLVHKMANS